MALAIASRTASGFGHEVAAWSKYLMEWVSLTG